MQRFHDVARIVSTKGLDGHVTLDCKCGSLFEGLLDSPGSSEPGLMLHFIPPQIDCSRSARIERVLSFDGQNAVVSFSDIETIDEASCLVGCHCLASADDVAALGLTADDSVSGLAMQELGVLEGSKMAEQGIESVEGWVIRDVNSPFAGRVEHASCPAGQILLEVATITEGGDSASSDGVGASLVLIPLVGELVCDVDESAREISMDLPAGLLEI